MAELLFIQPSEATNTTVLGGNVDIDKYLNARLKQAIEKYEQKSIDTTKQLSKQYFEALAFRYGFDLNLEFKN